MKHLNIRLPELSFAAEEALKRLRINVKFVGAETKVIMVTSSVPNEGKSFVSLFLWKMLAESGTKVLFMDLDLRNSEMVQRYSITCEHNLYGLEHYLSGNCDIGDIIYATTYDNAYMIPCTNELENPTNLFDDPNFSKMIEQLRGEYRYIIVDTPPLINVSDGALIASVCDSCIFVIKSGSTSKKLVRQSIRQLNNAGCSILGMVLNFDSVESKHYGYSSSYGYGYGHNDKKKDGK